MYITSKEQVNAAAKKVGILHNEGAKDAESPILESLLKKLGAKDLQVLIAIDLILDKKDDEIVAIAESQYQEI